MRVEYPKMDWKLHLLMLMYQQIEEARGLGNSEPRLEYREGSSELLIRVVDTDAVEEVRYSGMYHGDELVETPYEALKGLEADGYVEVDHTKSPDGMVNVAITKKGLERIKHRLAFESNMPRSLKSWEIFPKQRSVRAMRLWRVHWEGRQITVRNRRILLGKYNAPVTEYLNVNNRRPPGYRVEKPSLSKDLYGDLRTRDGKYELHAHIGLTAPFFKTGCLVAVDGAVIGGDVGKTFLT